MVVVAVAGLLAAASGCQGKTASNDGSVPGTSLAPASVGSPSASPQRYQIPLWSEICATAKTTGITVREIAKDADYPQFQEGCRISTGADNQIADVTVTFELSRSAAESFRVAKDNDWNKGSAFSGPARDKAVVEQVGSAKRGQDYDDAYYAFFPAEKVASVRASRTTVVVLRGNAVITFNVGGSEWHGAKPKRVDGLIPLGPEFGRTIVDKMADAMLALLTPA